MSKTSKAVRLSEAFRAAAITDPKGALATMILASFGVDLVTLIRIARDILVNKDEDAAIMAIAAAVQVRGNVVFVGRDFANIRSKYPELVIEGERAQQDIFNFGALHVLGHLLCHLSAHTIAQKALSKAGSCITGANTPDSEAGKINKEISQQWTPSDLEAFRSFVSATDLAEKAGQVFGNITGLKTKFQSAVTPNRPAVPPPAPPPPSSTSATKGT